MSAMVGCHTAMVGVRNGRAVRNVGQVNVTLGATHIDTSLELSLFPSSVWMSHTDDVNPTDSRAGAPACVPLLGTSSGGTESLQVTVEPTRNRVYGQAAIVFTGPGAGTRPPPILGTYDQPRTDRARRHLNHRLNRTIRASVTLVSPCASFRIRNRTMVSRHTSVSNPPAPAPKSGNAMD